MKRKSILVKHNTFSSKRSQAAMEFLMTYGWALIVVLIALAGLAYFGVLNIEQFMPEKIDMPPGLIAQKFFMTTEDNVLTIYLANGVGAPITNLQMSMPCQNGSLSNTIASLPEGKTDKIKIYCQMPEGSRLKGNINITYNTREMQKTFSRRFTGFASVYVPKSSCPATMNGAGTLGDPFQICNCIDLQNMNQDLDAYYVLVRNIDCMFDTKHPLGTLYNANKGFNPVGNETAAPTYYFVGTFNGVDHTISNLYINRSTYRYVGLFGISNSTSISNIGLVNINVSGNFSVGGLVGYSSGGSIANSYSSGSVSGGAGSFFIGGLVGSSMFGSIANSYSSGSVSVGTGSGQIGGLVGISYQGSVDNSYSSGSVSGGAGSFFIGGLVGYSYQGSVDNSYSSGSVSGGAGSERIGGLVGYFRSGDVDNSYSSGSVSGGAGSSAVGGLVGYSYVGSVDNSYSSGSVSGGAGSFFIGGLVGSSTFGSVDNSYSSGSVSGGAGSAGVGGLVGLSTFGSVVNSYSSGSVSGGAGSSAVGGLVGNNSDNGSCTLSYWDKQTSGQPASPCGTGNTTAQMKTPANYVGWDTTNIWTIAAGSYPRLRWQG